MSFSLNDLIIADVLAMIQAGKFNELSAIGVGPDEVRMLRLMPIGTITAASKISNAPLLKTVQIDSGVLADIVTDRNRAYKRDQAINRLVLANASNEIAYSLFGVNKREIARRREMLGHTKQGRTTVDHRKPKISISVKIDTLIGELRKFKAEEQAEDYARSDALIAAADRLGVSVIELYTDIENARASAAFDWPCVCNASSA